MEAKPVSESKVEIADIMLPEHANAAGNVHGGTIMKIIDNAGWIVTQRHSHVNVVTASVDTISFLSPTYIGNLVIAKASLNYVGKTSMEVGVRIEAESLETGIRTHIASAHLTYVALDKNDKPIEVPKVIPETEEQKRRYFEAKERRERIKRDLLEQKNKAQTCIERPAYCKID